MAWWRPDEEPSPQERIGAAPRVDATSRRRRRPSLPFSVPIAIAALVFVALFVLPFVLAFSSFDFGGDGDGFSGTRSREGPSLVPADRFAEAWSKVRAEAGPEDSLDILRVAPDRIDAIVAPSSGQRTDIQVWPDLSVTRFPAGSVTGGRGLSLRRFDTSLPERVVRRAAERLGVPSADVNYMALSIPRSLGRGGTWSVFFDGGGFVTADLDGSNMRVFRQ